MSTFNLRGLTWVGNSGGAANPDILDDPNFLEADSQSFVQGDLVYIASGAVTEWGLSASTAIAGIALTDATNTSSSDNVAIKILKIKETDIFEASLDDAVSAITMLGDFHYLKTTSAGVWVVDGDEVTNERVKIIGFVYQPEVDTSGNMQMMAMGDTDPRVLIKFLNVSAAQNGPLLQLD